MPKHTGREVKVAGRLAQAYNPRLALDIIERVAMGETLTTILKEPGMPHRSTLFQWFLHYPEAKEAYLTALELSARVFEEEGIEAARDLKDKPGTGTRVRAHETFLGQLRWSATRRSPREFGDRGNLNVVVPVQIITPLDIGQPGAQPSDAEATVYEMAAKVQVPALPPPEEPEPAEPTDEPPPLPSNSFHPGSGRKPWKRQTKTTQFTGKGSTKQGSVQEPRPLYKSKYYTQKRRSPTTSSTTPKSDG